jgi:pyroglutamyl-peptidase
MRHFYRAFLLSAFLAGAQAFANQSVLVTAFEPFGKDRSNSSELAVKALAKLPALKEKGNDLHVCILPVLFEKAAKVAEKCLERMDPKPSLIISTGQTPDCQMALETRFQNLDDSLDPDNAGKAPHRIKIEKTGPKYTVPTLPLAEMYCASRKGELRLSTDADTYVCNDLAYRLARKLEPKKIPFGFVHIPQTSCRGITTKKNAERLSRLLLAGVSSLETDGLTAEEAQEYAYCQAKLEAPVSRPEVVKILKVMKGASASLCKERYYKALRRAY